MDRQDDRYGGRGGRDGDDRYGGRGGRGGDDRYGGRGGRDVEERFDRRDDRDDRDERRGGAGPIPKELTMFVAGLPFVMSERDVTRKFGRYGRVEQVRLVRDPHSGNSKGFAFVAMSTAQEVTAAIDGENGRDWEGRRLLVERARTVRY